MEIAVLDRSALGDDVDLDKISEFGNVTIYDTTSREELFDRIKDLDVILMNKICMDEAAINAASNLKYIGVNATGTNNVDLKYAREKGITVTNVKSYSTNSVVQHTFALLFYVMEKLGYYDNYVKSGQYEKSPVFTNLDEKFHELYGKTWGIIGLGEIGRKVADIAKAFGCRAVYYSTSGRNSNPDYEQVDLDTLLGESDIISIHAPLNKDTENLMNSSAFDRMKKNAILINVGRGPIVNDNDLYEALVNDKIGGAALDVITEEPIRSDNPLLKIKDSRKLIITPHIAWGTVEARSRLIDEVYLNLKAFVNGEERNVVN